MTLDPQNNQYVFVAPSAVSLVGRRVTISSNLGGAYNYEVQ